MTRIILTLIALAAIALPSPAAESIDDATVVLASGWSYEHVTVTVAEGGALPIMRADGATLRLPVAEVAAVYDAGGRDVTPQMIPSRTWGPAATPPAGAPGDGAVPPADEQLQESWDGAVLGRDASGRQGPAASRDVKAFDLSLGAGVGYGFPFGEFYDGLDPGLVYSFDLRIATSPRHYLRFCYRNQNVMRESYGVQYPDGNPVDVEFSLDVRQYLLLFGFLSGKAPGISTRGYTEIGLAYADHVMSASSGGFGASESEGRVAFAVQAGAMIPFNEDGNVGADIGGYLLTKFIGDSSGEDVGFIFGLQAGLVLMFGGGE